MRHIDLCDAIDRTDAALMRRDYVAADRIRSSCFESVHPLAWFIAGEIGLRMAHARDTDRRPTVDQLKEVAA
jgi:hypothetical protein